MTGKLIALGLGAALLFAAVVRLPAQNNAAGGEPGGTESAEDSADFSRGSIPEELLRPRRGEAPRYPVDTVIGALGQGEAPAEAYLFAREVLAALTAGNKDAPGLSAMNSVSLEGFLSLLETISPRSYRIGSGRGEPDGAVSFLVRFIGREQGIAGELFVRQEDPPPDRPAAAEAGTEAAASAGAERTAAANGGADTRPPGGWIFEDLILEEARNREDENKDAGQRFDFSPYERFF
ncbi:MAG: hypothetical protein LBJ90_09005 [Treponema sp.]|jgi:hypothetical protein|nr:hypothetical protein [Treponema sp.]